jgi:hypothetical protein
MKKTTQAPAKARTPIDLFSLVVGLLFTAFATGALYLAFGGTYDPMVLKIALPVFLVALGAAGLLLSRRT